MATDPMGYPFASPYLAPQTLGGAPGLWGGVQPMSWMGTPALANPLGMFNAGMPGAQPEANLEAQALSGFLQDITSNSIRKLYEYLSNNVEKFPQLANAVNVLNTAVELFKAKDYARAFSQIYEVYRHITAARATAPDLPALSTS
jgi:hypothetical protein